MDKELKELLLELEKDILRSMDGKISQEVKQVYKEEVEYMYAEFEPNSYVRRYDDNGFLDENNWDIDISLANTGATLTLTNETMANGDNTGDRLDNYIEEGIYNWNRQPSPRPVYERTQNRLNSETVIENILESELRKKGWELK